MRKESKGKLTLIIVCFAVLGLLTGVIVEQYINQEVAIERQNNRIENYEINAYVDAK